AINGKLKTKCWAAARVPSCILCYIVYTDRSLVSQLRASQANQVVQDTSYRNEATDVDGQYTYRIIDQTRTGVDESANARSIDLFLRLPLPVVILMLIGSILFATRMSDLERELTYQ